MISQILILIKDILICTYNLLAVKKETQTRIILLFKFKGQKIKTCIRGRPSRRHVHRATQILKMTIIMDICGLSEASRDMFYSELNLIRVKSAIQGIWGFFYVVNISLVTSHFLLHNFTLLFQIWGLNVLWCPRPPQN